jgi:Cu(I)/Ag(I) efflux system membrane fusion protein
MLALLLAFSGCSKTKQQDQANIATAEKKDLYYCPMHHQVTSDKPGICPICGMDLVKKASDDEVSDQKVSDGEHTLSLSKTKQVLANVSTVVVSSKRIKKELNVYSVLDFSEPKRKIISARFNGRIEKLHVDKIGINVDVGTPLFDIYSPEILQAQNDYLIAIKNKASQGTEINTLISALRTKLSLFGMTEKQISDLETSSHSSLVITFLSPAKGIVLEKNVLEGSYINEGAILYAIADLSELWALSEVNEKDLGGLKNGSSAGLSVPAFPHETFRGRISFISPVVNEQTRSVQVRSVFSNHQLKLKPKMWGTIRIGIVEVERMVVPREAVLITGKRNIVWVKSGEKTFEMHNVDIGDLIENEYEILSGLKKGDEIAVTGGYLIDSESQLQSGNNPHAGMDMSPATKTDQRKASEKQRSQSTQQMQKSSDPHAGMVMPSPKTSTQKKAGDDHSGHSAQQIKIFNTVCPVLGAEVDPDVTPVLYKGKYIGFCCGGCDETFKKNPEKYMQNLSEDGKQFLKKVK